MASGNSQYIVICSEHPIAFEWIRDIMSGDPCLCHKLRPYSKTTTFKMQPPALLILDCCSTDDWPAIAIRWQRWGGKIVCIVSAEFMKYREQVRAIYLGACGFVPALPSIRTELPAAVHAVLEGRLWYSRSVLGECVKLTQLALNRGLSSSQSFTAREDQIISFVTRKFRNKQIADALDISERTVKYHVSNILRKSQVSSRGELLSVMRPGLQETDCARRPNQEMTAD
jgi:DNA-binding NarL/FixJ family response regulator